MAEFTIESIALLEQDIATALKTVEKKHDVTFQLTRPTKGFHRNSVDLTLAAMKPNPYRADYIKHAPSNGAKLEWLDRVFWDFKRGGSVATDDFQIVGFKPATKQVICDKLRDNKPTGKHFAFSVETIAQRMISQAKS